MMASFIITDAEYIVTGKTVTVNYTTDKQLRDVKITNDDQTYIDSITFSQTSALFDISSWPNGPYTTCKLRGWYNDNIPIMIADKASISINETTSTALNVYLDRAPDYDVTISITSSDTNTVTVSPSSLKFTPSNYSTSQPITISGVYNSVDYNKNANVTLSNAEMDPVIIPVTVVNTDILYGNIVLSDTSLTINEKSSATFTVKLASKPTNNQTVLLSSNNSNITLNKTSLTFTPTNYNTAQTVTVTGGYNADTNQRTSTITASSTNVTSKTISITINNIDAYGDIVLNKTAISINEGESTTFTVKLASEPTNNQTVTLSLNNSNITLDKTSLIFTPTNYNTAQTVTVTGEHDSTHYSDKTSTITLSSSYIASSNINITVKNIDTPPFVYGDISLNKSTMSIDEGETATFTVKLASKPTNNQIVTLSPNNSNITLDKTSLTFTPTNYNTIQTVTVTGVVDDESYDDKTSTITASSPNVANKTISVTIVNTTVESIMALLDKQGYLRPNGDGGVISNQYYVSTDFIDISEMITKGMTITVEDTSTNTLLYQFDTYNLYDSTRNLYAGTTISDVWSILTFEPMVIPSDVHYIRFTICRIDRTQINTSNNALITITPLT